VVCSGECIIIYDGIHNHDVDSCTTDRFAAENLRQATDNKKKRGSTRPFNHFIKKTNKQASKEKSYSYNLILIREKILQNTYSIV
jgi:hypothetical protein